MQALFPQKHQGEEGRGLANGWRGGGPETKLQLTQQTHMISIYPFIYPSIHPPIYSTNSEAVNATDRPLPEKQKTWVLISPNGFINVGDSFALSGPLICQMREVLWEISKSLSGLFPGHTRYFSVLCAMLVIIFGNRIYIGYAPCFPRATSIVRKKEEEKIGICWKVKYTTRH